MTSPSDLPLYQAHVAAGGGFGDRRGQPVVASYGEPVAEYAAARSGAGLVDLALRAVLEASGPLRQKFLQGMLSHEVAGRRPGQGCRAALMSAKGGLQALVRVLVDESVVLLETDFDRVGPLQNTLEHHRVAAPVRFAASPGVVLALLGPMAPEVLRAAGAETLPSEAEDHARVALAGHAARLVKAGDLPGGGFVLHAAEGSAPGAWEALRAAGARPVGFDALDTRRVETIRPWWGSDVTEENLLHETGLVDECHSATKGCYVGQEVVARLSARGGNVSKALRGLRLEAPVAAGAAVTVDGKEAGRVTTAVVSPRLGPIALAYVHRNHFAAGTAVQAGGVAAIVVTGFEDEAAPAAGERRT